MSYSREKITDAFTGMLTRDGRPASRQAVHMARKKAKGLCITCGEPAVGVYCVEHRLKYREYMRAKRGSVKRLKGEKSLSYTHEEK